MLSPFTDAPANLGETSKKTPTQRFNKKFQRTASIKQVPTQRFNKKFQRTASIKQTPLYRLNKTNPNVYLSINSL
jgi:hypothetical protein